MIRVRSVVLGMALGCSSLLLGCGGGGGFPPDAGIDGPPPTGNFTLAWSLKSTTNEVIACETIGAQSVTALLRNRAVQGGSTEVFTCGTGMGTSQGIAPGLYDINFELVGAGGAPQTGLISTAPAQMGIMVGPGETVPLTPLTFTVDATGGLKLKLSSNTSGGNCAPTATNGAGITTMSITLNKASDLSCAPITFNVSAGATGTAGTYTVNCTTPSEVPCIENDQELTATGVASGNYIIHVRGLKAAASCWHNDDSIPVPGLGRDLVRTLNLGFQSTTVGC